jgi:hypothetical protein
MQPTLHPAFEIAAREAALGDWINEVGGFHAELFRAAASAGEALPSLGYDTPESVLVACAYRYADAVGGMREAMRRILLRFDASPLASAAKRRIVSVSAENEAAFQELLP